MIPIVHKILAEERFGIGCKIVKSSEAKDGSLSLLEKALDIDDLIIYQVLLSPPGVFVCKGKQTILYFSSDTTNSIIISNVILKYLIKVTENGTEENYIKEVANFFSLSIIDAVCKMMAVNANTVTLSALLYKRLLFKRKDENFFYTPKRCYEKTGVSVEQIVNSHFASTLFVTHHEIGHLKQILENRDALEIIEDIKEKIFAVRGKFLPEEKFDKINLEPHIDDLIEEIFCDMYGFHTHVAYVLGSSDPNEDLESEMTGIISCLTHVTTLYVARVICKISEDIQPTNNNKLIDFDSIIAAGFIRTEVSLDIIGEIVDSIPLLKRKGTLKGIYRQFVYSYRKSLTNYLDVIFKSILLEHNKSPLYLHGLETCFELVHDDYDGIDFIEFKFLLLRNLPRWKNRINAANRVG